MMRAPVPLRKPSGEVDGRTLRTTRTRRLVVEALLDLLEAGEPQPTAQQVSDRCGVSMRSIFRLFEDVEAMHAAAVAAQIDRVGHLLVPLDRTGSLATRVKALVDSRAKLFETISPVRRMAVRIASTSPTIRADLAVANGFLRAQVVELFDAELRALPSAKRRDVVDVLDVASSWETWERLRSAQGITDRRARRLVAGLLSCTLAGGPDAGRSS